MVMAQIKIPAVLGRHLPCWSWLLLPAVVFLLIFFVLPLFKLVSLSLPGGDAKHYAQVLTTPVFLRIIGETFRVSLIVMAICTVLAYPYAWAMAQGSRRVVLMLTAALLVPFWVSLLLRSFSWLLLLQDTGLINQALLGLGLIDSPLRLVRTPGGVMLAMVHILLPYAVLPLYAVMKKIDLRLLEASASCGASGLRGFVRVYLPLSLPGIMAAAILTFTLSLGFYITPALLGSPRNMLIGQMIASQFNEQLNFALGAALAVVLMALTAAAFGVFAAAHHWLTRHGLSRQRVSNAAVASPGALSA